MQILLASWSLVKSFLYFNCEDQTFLNLQKIIKTAKVVVIMKISILCNGSIISIKKYFPKQQISL